MTTASPIIEWMSAGLFRVPLFCIASFVICFVVYGVLGVVLSSIIDFALNIIGKAVTLVEKAVSRVR